MRSSLESLVKLSCSRARKAAWLMASSSDVGPSACACSRMASRLAWSIAYQRAIAVGLLAFVPDDAEGPGLQRGLRRILRQPLPGGHEHLLCQALAQPGHAELPNRVTMVAQEGRHHLRAVRLLVHALLVDHGIFPDVIRLGHLCRWRTRGCLHNRLFLLRKVRETILLAGSTGWRGPARGM